MSTLTTIVTASWVSLLLSLAACTTTKQPSSDIPRHSCYCGKLDEPGACAVWTSSDQGTEPKSILGSVDREDCSLAACQEEFREVCHQISLWPQGDKGTRLEPQESCFCDTVWVEVAGEPKLACAAWSPDEPWLIEYYFKTECQPETCKTAPFKRASRFCPNGFHPFYLPSGQQIPSDT